MLKSEIKTNNNKLFDKENPPDTATLVVFSIDGEIALWCPNEEIFVVLNEGNSGYAEGYTLTLADKIRISAEDIFYYVGSVILTQGDE